MNNKNNNTVTNLYGNKNKNIDNNDNINSNNI